MKKLLVFMLLAFGGCVTVRDSGRIVAVSVTDFTPYTSHGFLITPEQYLGDYESIGSIKIIIFPAVKKYIRGMDMSDADWEMRAFGSERWLVEHIDTKMLIDTMYRKAVEMGANAVTRFSIDPLFNFENAASPLYYEVNGFAIKRRPPK